MKVEFKVNSLEFYIVFKLIKKIVFNLIIKRGEGVAH